MKTVRILAVGIFLALAACGGSSGSTDDADGDGILDGSDNCPAVSNAGQADVDADGIGDACDPCPGACDPPAPVGDSLPATEDEARSIPVGDLLANDVDADGDALQVVAVKGASHGAVSLGTGTVVFTPEADFFGTAGFTYEVSDGISTAEATVTVEVAPVNDPPTFDAIGDLVVLSDGRDRTVAVTGVAAGPANEAGQVVTLTATSSDPSILPHPVAAGAGTDRTLTLSPVVDADATVVVTVVADDGEPAGGTSSRTFSVTLQPPPPRCGDGLLEPGELCYPRSHPTAGWPGAPATADFDRDGFVDVAVGGSQTGVEEVAVHLNDGRGGLLPAVHYAVSGSPAGLAVADFDGDDLLDIATGGNAAGDVSILYGLPGGAFAPEALLDAGPLAGDVITGDFDADGCADLAVGTGGNGTVNVLLGACNGTFDVPRPASVGVTTSRLAAGRMDADASLDLVVSSKVGDVVRVLLGAGDGTFSAPLSIGAGNGPSALALADLDEDGDTDVVAAAVDGGEVVLLRGVGDGSLSAPSTLLSVPFPTGLFAEDADGDGHADVGCGGGKGDDAVHLLFGAGDGTFPRTATYRIGERNAQTALTDGASPALADVDADGTLDLLGAGFSTRSLAILRGRGDGTFNGHVRYDAGPATTTPPALALGDIDGAGAVDVLFTASPAKEVGVCLTGAQGALSCTRHAVGTTPMGLAVGRIDGDGLADVAVANSGDGTLGVLLQFAGGGFAPQSVYATGTGPRAVALGALDAGGTIDAVVANYGAGTVSVLLGDGSGGFGPQASFAVGSGPTALAVADVAGSSALDVVAANASSGDLSLLVGKGDGTFEPEVRIALPAAPSALLAHDVDGDGDQDLLVSSSAGSAVACLLQGPSGTFSATSYPAGGKPQGLAVGDVDADGLLDVLVADDDGFVAALRGAGAGAFHPASTLVAPKGAARVGVADLDGDADPDVVVVSGAAGALDVLFAEP